MNTIKRLLILQVTINNTTDQDKRNLYQREINKILEKNFAATVKLEPVK